MFPALSLHALQNKLRGCFNHTEWLPWLQQAKETGLGVLISDLLRLFLVLFWGE